MKHLTRFFLATFIAALMLGGRAEAQTTSTWANSNVAGTPASPLDWFTGGPNTQGTWTGGTPASNSATTIQFFENTTTALTNTATPSSQTVNLNNGGSAFQLGTLTLSGLASATANANLTMTLSGDALNFSGATGTINLNALNNLSSGTRTITYNVNNNIQLGTASSASALTIGGAGNGTFVLGGIISELQAGGGSLTKSGGSTVSLAGANTYTGATTVTGGVLLLNNANALPGGIGATGGTSALTLNGGVVGLTSNFSRGIGTSASQVQWASNGGGFAAYGADRTVNLGGNATPSTITWGNTAANGGFNGRTLILGAADATHTVELVNGLDLGSGARQINVNNGAATFDAKLSGAIVGTGGLQLGNYQVGGSILLTGSNSYSGGTTIANVNGVVAISNANALGTGTVSMRQQMTLASTSPTPLTLNNRISYDNRDLRFTAKLGSADATGNLTLAGGLNFEKGGSWTSDNSNAAFVELVGLSSVDITGQISGTYVSPTNAEVGFQVKAGQTLRLGADNSAWTQNVVLAYPGTTVIGHAKALGNGTFLRFGTFDLGVGSAAGNSVVVSEVDLTGANALTQTVTIERVGSGSDYTAGGFAGTRSIELAGGVGFFAQGKSFANNISGGSLLISGDVRGTRVGATAEAYFVGTGNTTITGNIHNGDAATLNFRSENTGITTLSGSNTYNGATTVNAGTLVFGGTQAKAAGTVTAAAAGSIGLGVGGANSYTSANVAALFGNTLTGFSMNAASGVAVDTTGGNFTVSDALAGTRAFTKLGPNTLTLSGNNTFSGAFTVSEGGISIATINNASANGPLGNRAGAVLLGSSGKTGTLEYTGATASSTKPFTAVAGGTAVFSVTDAAAVLTLSGGIDGDGAKSFGGAGSTNVSGGVSGGNVIKTGAGALTLSTGNGQANTTVSSGQLNVNHIAALGTTTGTLTMAAGTRLDNTSGAAVAVGNPKSIALGNSLTFVGTDDLGLGGGTTTLSASTTFDIQAGELAFGGDVVGAGFGIIKNGAGTLALGGLTGSNSFTGNSTINAGKLLLEGTSVLGGGSSTVVTLGENGFLEVGASASLGNVTIAGYTQNLITNTPVNANQDFTVSQTLSTANTKFNGVQTIGSGVTVTTTHNYLGTIPISATPGRIVFENGATLAATANFEIDPNQGVSLNAGTAIVSVDAGKRVFFESVVAGSGGLRKIGAGNLRLTSSNSYQGGTVIEQGILGISLGAALGDVSSSVTIDGATLAAASYPDESGTGATIDAARTVLIGNGKTSGLHAQTGLTLRYDGAIAEVDSQGAAGSLQFGFDAVREGTVILGGANTYRGDTILSHGTLKLGSGGSFANSALIVVGDAGSNGAVFDLTEKSTFAIGAGQTLKGKGTVLLGENTAVTINGLLSPGNSPGLLTWSGSGSVALSGTTLMEVWGTSRGANPGYDAIDLTNGTDLTFGGILQLDFNQLFADGTTFNLFTPDGTSSLASTFSSITMVGSSYTDLTFTNNAGLWTTNTGAANQSMTFNSATGTLSIIVVPEPAGIALAGLGLAAAAFAYRRRRRCP